MKGDFTRNTFRPDKHYSGVLMQQGRVQLDADWNEQQAITRHRVETEARDVIGLCGAPEDNAGFGITAQHGKLLIGKGRIYVDGILCENEIENLPYDEQPNFPDAPGWMALLEEASTSLALVYLDVWQRHVTALDDPLIREVALGGPDTATRVKTVWQVKVLPISPNERATCTGSLEEWDRLVAGSSGTLNARTQAVADEDDPCLPSPAAGYQRLENQLYRVEIHESGDLGEATFKWSRDNGTIVTSIKEINGNRITVHDLGRDDVLGFATGQWAEISDDVMELGGQRTELVQIEIEDVDAKGEPPVITLPSAPTGIDMARHPKLRRWDSPGVIAVQIPVENDGWIKLEGGIEVRFSPGTYRSGDYWLIPARTATGEIEWPPYEVPNTTPEAQLPAGIEHHYCRLALVTKGEGERWLVKIRRRQALEPWRVVVSEDRRTLRFEPPASEPQASHWVTNVKGMVERILSTNGYDLLRTEFLGNVFEIELNAADISIDLFHGLFVETDVQAGTEVTNCPCIFPPICDITTSNGQEPYRALRYVGGDGQEGSPGETLPCTLAVGVEDESGRPVPGAKVTFEVRQDNCGSLSDLDDPANSGTNITVPTGNNGIAEVEWKLGEGLQSRPCCQVEARLEDPPPPQESALDVHFKATARKEGEERVWPRVKEISWQNDQPLLLSKFNDGLWVSFTKPMDPQTADSDTFIVALELPTVEPPAFELMVDSITMPILESSMPELCEALGEYKEVAYRGHRIFIVPGKVESQDDTVWHFTPAPIEDTMLRIWLEREKEFFPGLEEERQIRCRVVLKSNTILSKEGEPLDGEAFGRMADDGTIDLEIPYSGDGRKGGDFESWFYLIQD